MSDVIQVLEVGESSLCKKNKHNIINKDMNPIKL